MPTLRTTVVDRVEAELQDAGNANFTAAEIGTQMDYCLEEIALYIPNVVKETVTTTAIWVASTAYSVGDFVSPTTENGYRYECTTAGTSDSSEPTWPTDVTSDTTTVTDGTVTWTIRSTMKDIDVSGIVSLLHGFNKGSFKYVEHEVDLFPRRYRNFELYDPKTLTIDLDFNPDAARNVYLYCYKPWFLDAAWATGTAYTLGQFVMPTTVAKMNGFHYECTTAGTSHAATEPTWPAYNGTTVADNTVTWTARTAHDIPLQIERLLVGLTAGRTAISKGSRLVDGIPYVNWGHNRLQDVFFRLRQETVPKPYRKWPRGK
jgi:hypothetical protein